MLYVYPAIIHEDVDGVWAEFPDLPGCQTFSDSVSDLLAEAGEALECELVESLERGDTLPKPTPMNQLAITKSSYLSLIRIDIDLAKNTTVQNTKPSTASPIVQTSQNNPALARKIREVSARILKENYQLYKNLENK